MAPAAVEEANGTKQNDGTTSSTLRPLKTVTELMAASAVLDVYITVVPIKAANSVLKYVQRMPNTQDVKLTFPPQRPSCPHRRL
jgi:hypothetical protein